MLDLIIVKKLLISANLVDLKKSYISFDSNTSYNIIELYLNKENNLVCPICGSKYVYVRGSKISRTKTSFQDAPLVFVNVHRRTYVCDNNHHFSQENPITPECRKMTAQFEVLILKDLKNINTNFKTIAKKYDVSSTYLIDLFDRKVDIKRQHLPQVLCIDEVYAKKLAKYSYCCVLYSPQLRKIIDVLDSRRKIDLVDYFAKIPIDEKNKVKFISMDLWDSYREIAKLCLPNAKISADPFHVVKNLTECFTKIRIAVMNKYVHLKKEKTTYYWLYKKYWKFLLKDKSKLPNGSIKVNKLGMEMTKDQIIDNMLSLSETLAKAYELKEEYRNFVATATLATAEDELDSLIIKFKDAHIPEYSKFINIMENWHDEIINSFNTINGHKITNGPMERVNRDIKQIFLSSYGSSNFTRMRNRIMYCINDDASILYYKKEKSNKREMPARGKYNKNK